MTAYARDYHITHPDHQAPTQFIHDLTLALRQIGWKEELLLAPDNTVKTQHIGAIRTPAKSAISVGFIDDNVTSYLEGMIISNTFDQTELDLSELGRALNSIHPKYSLCLKEPIYSRG